MQSVRSLYEAIFEDKGGSIPRGRKFAKKGPQGAWKALPDEMKQSYIKDLEGYFDPPGEDGSSTETPEQFVERNSLVFEEGGDIHLVLVEPDSGTELESIWDDSKDSWDHQPAPDHQQDEPEAPAASSPPGSSQQQAAGPAESLRRPGGSVRR